MDSAAVVSRSLSYTPALAGLEMAQEVVITQNPIIRLSVHQSVNQHNRYCKPQLSCLSALNELMLLNRIEASSVVILHLCTFSILTEKDESVGASFCCCLLYTTERN